MSCTCGPVGVGNTVMGLNWEPDCEKHGTHSEWWNSEEQRAARAERRRESVDLWRRAREARKAHSGEAGE